MADIHFLTVKEFASRLRVTREQVYKWIEYGRVKAIRITDSAKSPWRIPQTELKRMHAKAYDESYELDEEDEV